MIEARALTKRFGDHVAVDDLTTTIAAGRVTGLLGPAKGKRGACQSQR